MVARSFVRLFVCSYTCCGRKPECCKICGGKSSHAILQPLGVFDWPRQKEEETNTQSTHTLATGEGRKGERERGTHDESLFMIHSRNPIYSVHFFESDHNSPRFLVSSLPIPCCVAVLFHSFSPQYCCSFPPCGCVGNRPAAAVSCQPSARPRLAYCGNVSGSHSLPMMHILPIIKV